MSDPLGNSFGEWCAYQQQLHAQQNPLAAYQQQAQQGLYHGAGSTNAQIHSGAIIFAGGGAGAATTVTSPFQPGRIYPQGSGTYGKPLENAGIKVGEIIGWRIWCIKGDFLESYSALHVWPPHTVMKGNPKEYNSEGIWAFKEKSRALYKLMQATGICGSVKMWGNIIEHSEGYRAEFATVDELYEIYRPGFELKEKRLLKKFKERYETAA